MSNNSSRTNPILRILGDLLYPDKCGICDFVGDGSPCDRCRSEFDIKDMDIDTPLGILKRCVAIYPYDSVGREAVRNLKFHRHTSLAEFMSQELQAAVVRLSMEHLTVVPVPVHRSRLAERGFNQAELLSEHLENPRLPAGLLRVRPTKPQASLTPSERATNLLGAFEADSSVAGLEILLIDDVCTTGATVTECAKALIQSGAFSVSALSFAGGR